tara:strand:- start:255 stop:1229 length:975 start_codon:yes stop_codon:yes gene_type:complete
MRSLLLTFLIFIYFQSFSQDTFSIIAVDTETGEVGAAGATCLFGYNDGIIDMISQIIPGKGGVLSQAYVCIPNINMNNAISLMNEGYSPSQIITWLNNNDDCSAGNYLYRQYGIVDFDDNGEVRTAGFTGNFADDYKEDRQGETYSIQGNILLDQSIIDNMENNFLSTEGSLSDKLMAAMQGANVAGADSRCLQYGTSSATAFLVVYSPNDSVDQPSLEINIGSQQSGIEPIDILQESYNEFLSIENFNNENIKLIPNPTDGIIHVDSNKNYQIEVFSNTGKSVLKTFGNKVDIAQMQNGIYFVKLADENTGNVISYKVIKKDQ